MKNFLETNPQKLPETGFIRLPQLLQIYGIGRSTAYDWMSKGLLPQSVKLGPKVVAWNVQDIRAHIERLTEAAA